MASNLKLILRPSKYLVKQIVTHPIMLRAHSGMEDYDASTWEPDSHTQYIVCVDVSTGENIGMLTFKPFTNQLTEAHIYILPEFWGQGHSTDFAKLAWKVLQPGKLFTYTPSSCTQVQKFIESIGFKKQTSIQNGISYNNETVDLLFYTADKIGD